MLEAQLEEAQQGWKAEVEMLEKNLEEKANRVTQLVQANKELEAQKQATTTSARKSEERIKELETSHKMVMEASQSATNNTMKQKADVDSPWQCPQAGDLPPAERTGARARAGQRLGASASGAGRKLRKP